ncbi:hypothetical protein [Parvibacter caecicola]|uniref:hypothetical protein n=1 Tax=Parvibacter caecicola TaxID=747645 RepID=UPI0027314E7F|nr:hypothetical protein [Parvibacter caecicola]
MAKAKKKSFHHKVVQRQKRILKSNWSAEVDRFSKELPALLMQDRQKIDGHPLAAGTPNTYRGDSFLRNAIDRDLQLQGLEVMFYPSIVQLWERMPRVLQLGPRAVQAFDEGENFLGTPLRQLDRLFPSCLLVDVRPLQWTLFDEELDHVFVFPVYDDKADCVLLYYVGAGPKGWALAIESKLILNGENFDTARAFSEAEHRRAWIMQLSGMGTCVDAPFYYDPFLDEQEFGAVVDNIVAMAVSDRATLLTSEEDGVEVLTALLDYTPEEEAPGEAEPKDDEPPAPSPEAGVSAEEGPAAAEPSPDAPEPDAAEPVAGEEAVPIVGLLTDGAPRSEDPRLEEAWLENLRLQEELEAVRAGFDKAVSEANFKLASTLHRTRTLEMEAEALRKENGSLRTRASLVDNLRLPQTPAEALWLAADAFPDRLLFLPPAVKSAEEFSHGSTAEVWDVLRAMAAVLHPLIFGQEGGHVAKRFQDQAGFELTLRDMKANKRNQAFARLRTVEYNQKVHDMTAHVKGRSNKPGETLRVHFFADYDQGKLVIGHCGEHLPTSKTASL